MGHKKKVREEKKAAAAAAAEEQLTLPIIYHELRKDWAVPGRLLNLSMEHLREDQEFKATVDDWLDGMGLSEAVGLESNFHPNRGSSTVRKFVGDGGFLLYAPDKKSQDHPGLIFRQAQLAQESAKAHADSLLKEEDRKGKAKVAETSSASGGNPTPATSPQKSMLKESSDELSMGIKALNDEKTDEKIKACAGEILGLKKRVDRVQAILSSFEAVYKRKLLAAFRIEVARLLKDVEDVEMDGDGPSSAWWCGFILDPSRIALLSDKSAIDFDVTTLRMTGYSSMPKDVYITRAAVVGEVRGAPEVFSTFVRQFRGAARGCMEKIYKLVFGREASEDAIGDGEYCSCPVHCYVEAFGN